VKFCFQEALGSLKLARMSWAVSALSKKRSITTQSSGMFRNTTSYSGATLCQTEDFACNRHRDERDAGEKNVFG
jgi:hypothetical protein